ncbi:hypothetical protein EVAR_92878_1 [Eumeta japonica]|uniref:Uncharacterized protein n=1 Tax=Eumeta variegata TaxID=151549 RepID=A0A4C1TB49_EUMVA|nr:hypothetical protein EVAR_92878_1 [Eumeta japonica]
MASIGVYLSSAQSTPYASSGRPQHVSVPLSLQSLAASVSYLTEPATVARSGRLSARRCARAVIKSIRAESRARCYTRFYS